MFFLTPLYIFDIRIECFIQRVIIPESSSRLIPKQMLFYHRSLIVYDIKIELFFSPFGQAFGIGRSFLLDK